jgi:hypothetical protein
LGEGANAFTLASSPGADPTGFEPAVSGVTGRRVRPLHYGSIPCAIARGGMSEYITERAPVSTAGHEGIGYASAGRLYVLLPHTVMLRLRTRLKICGTQACAMSASGGLVRMRGDSAIRRMHNKTHA